MYYDQKTAPVNIAKKSDFAIFVDGDAAGFEAEFSAEIPSVQIIKVAPGKNHKIAIEQIREVISRSNTRQTSDTYVLISMADRMNEPAQNGFLKLLEEPPENYHFVMQVKDASLLLPTVLSRGDLYVLKTSSPLESAVSADALTKSYAKLLITAKPSDLPGLAKRLTSEKIYKKDGRGFTLAVVECAIEILYKSYFKTKKLAYLKKLPKLVALHDNLKQNGHIKLHLVADLC